MRPKRYPYSGQKNSALSRVGYEIIQNSVGLDKEFIRERLSLLRRFGQ